MDIKLYLTLLSGLCWTIVYIDGIRIGIKDKSYALPLWALGLNIAWEFLYTVVGYQAAGLKAQIVINGIWFLLDIGLVYTYFRHGKKYFPEKLKSHWFYMWGTLVILVSFVLQYTFLTEFGFVYGATYAAYLQNLLMSILFIAMLLQRSSSEGQTMTIAMSKWIGSLAPTISFGILGGGPFAELQSYVLVVGILMVIFDLVYIWLLAAIKAQERRGISSGVFK